MRVRGIPCLTDGRHDHLLEAVDVRSGAPALEEPPREWDEPSAFGIQSEGLHPNRIRVLSFPPSPRLGCEGQRILARPKLLD